MKRLVIAALLIARVAAADEADYVTYKVKPGDTIDLVAAEFYGDHVRTSLFIVDENKWKTYRKLNPGERIRVPIAREITTSKGDTLQALATKYLGDASRATYIAQLNNPLPTCRASAACCAPHQKISLSTNNPPIHRKGKASTCS